MAGFLNFREKVHRTTEQFVRFFFYRFVTQAFFFKFSHSVTHITLIHYVIKLWYSQFKNTKSVDTKNLQCVRNVEGNHWRDILTQSVHCKCWPSFGLNFKNFFSIKRHNKHQIWMLQHIMGTESGCHPDLVFAAIVHLKLEENEYLIKLVLLPKQYSTYTRDSI